MHQFNLQRLSTHLVIFLQMQQIRMQDTATNMAASTDTPDMTPISQVGKGVAK